MIWALLHALAHPEEWEWTLDRGSGEFRLRHVLWRREGFGDGC